MTKSVYFMDNISQLHACGWNTLALARADLLEVQATMRAAHPAAALVMSCQRVEAYGFERCDCPAPQAWHGRGALEHLAEVAAGLHSAVLGESQILGQVRDGFALAPERVRRLGDVAVSAARELRRRTDFNSHAGHLLDRALKVARIPAGGTILVLGTGQMGCLVAERAREIGFDRVIVAGRAHREGLPAEFVALNRTAALAPVDVVVGCLGSGAAEIDVATLPQARLILDLGTPRNVVHSPGHDDLSAGNGGPRLLTIAELMADEAKRPHALRRRAQLRRELHTIINRRLQATAEDGASLVGTLRANIESLRKREVERMRHLHPEVPEATIEAMTRSLVNQLMHRPTTRLRKMDAESGRKLVSLFAD